MDKLIEFYSNINRYKYIEEQIVRDLRALHADWVIKEEVEIEKPLNIVKNNEKNDLDDPELEQLKEIDALLNKAQKVYCKINSNEKAKSSQTPPNPKPAASKTTPKLNKPTETKQQEQKETTIPNKTSTTIPSRLPSSSSTTSISSSNSKKAPKPVYMNAPFKTEQVNPFKVSKPFSKPMIHRSSSATGHRTQPAKPNTQPKQQQQQQNTFKQAPTIDKQEYQIDQQVLQETSNNKRSNSIQRCVSEEDTIKKETPFDYAAFSSANTYERMIVENEYKFNLKTHGKDLRLPPNLEECLMKNYKLKQQLIKVVKQDIVKQHQQKEESVEQQFMQKLEKNCLKQSSPAFIHHLLNRMKTVFDKTTKYTQSILEDCELLSNELNEVDMIKLNKLNLFYDKLIVFEQKLNLQMDAIYKQIDSYYEIGKLSDYSIIENKLFSKNTNSNNGQTNESNDYDLLFDQVSVSYKNENELKRYYELKCDLIETKFNILLIDLSNIYLNYFQNLNSIDGKLIEQYNLLFNLITNKTTFIVKQ